MKEKFKQSSTFTLNEQNIREAIEEYIRLHYTYDRPIKEIDIVVSQGSRITEHHVKYIGICQREEKYIEAKGEVTWD